MWIKKFKFVFVSEVSHVVAQTIFGGGGGGGGVRVKVCRFSLSVYQEIDEFRLRVCFCEAWLVEDVNDKPVTMSDCLERSGKISLLKEPLVRRLCELLDTSRDKGWRKLGEIVGSDRRFKIRWLPSVWDCNLDYDLSQHMLFLFYAFCNNVRMHSGI